MIYLGHYTSPLGPITLASDGEFLTGLWFDGQKYDRCTLRGVKPDQITDLEKPEQITDLEKPEQITDPGELEGERPIRGGESACKFREVLNQACSWLDIYFSGQQPDFTPPLKVEGSAFKQLVAEIMLSIPYGKTMTYGEIAARAAVRMGRVRMSAQAVGGAVGHNAISIIIPCHRVTGSDGSLTGYAGGLDRKKALLELERKATFHEKYR